MPFIEGGFSAVRRTISLALFTRMGLLVGAVVAALAVDPADARAEAAPAPAARDAVAQARQAYDAGRLAEAIEAYKRAYELAGDAALLFQLGEVSRELGQDVAALRFYRSYLARDPRGKYRDAADRAARALELQGSKTEGGTESAPAPVPAEPVRRAPAPAAPARAPVALPPAPPPAATGAPAPTPAPAPPPEVRTAPPAVDLRADVTATPAPRSDTPLPRWLPWAGVGATLALGAGAVVTGVQANHRYDQLRASCGKTTEGCQASDINDVKSRALTANVLWAAAGVGAVATGIVVFVNAREAGFAGAWSF
jgi:tetratricopeptide (TPR) repeat protein